MIRPIIKDVLFLGQKCDDAGPGDASVADDLRDTLQANRERCVGMAANMIGVKKRVIIINSGFGDIVMFNPRITKKDSPYTAQEGCLSLTGVRTAQRYKNIEVEYLDAQFNKHRQKFSGWTAQIIQHEIDHCSGIVI